MRMRKKMQTQTLQLSPSRFDSIRLYRHYGLVYVDEKPCSFSV